MKSVLHLLASGLLAAALFDVQPVHARTSAEQSTSAAKPSSFDQKFVSKAVKGGLAEVELGELASKKGTREDVRKFGQRMVADHGKANAELKSLAKKKGFPVPGNLASESSKKLEKLSKLEGDEFDKAYIKEMLEDHEHDVKEFHEAAAELGDPDLKAFVKETLPVLKSHLQSIKEIENSRH